MPVVHILSHTPSKLPITELLHEKRPPKKPLAASSGPNISSRLQNTNVSYIFLCIYFSNTQTIHK